MFAFMQQVHEWMSESAAVNFLRFRLHVQSLKFPSLNYFPTKETYLDIRLMSLQPNICHEISRGLIFKMAFLFSALLFETRKQFSF